MLVLVKKPTASRLWIFLCQSPWQFFNFDGRVMITRFSCKSHFRFLFLIVPPLCSGTAVSQAYVTCLAWFSLVWERDELNLQYVLCWGSLLIRSFYNVREIFIDFTWIESRYRSTGSLRAFSILLGFRSWPWRRAQNKWGSERDIQVQHSLVVMAKGGQRSFPVPAWSVWSSYLTHTTLDFVNFVRILKLTEDHQ